MADLLTEKLEIRKQLISAANIYRSNLAGKVFLYVYGENYFEVAFMTHCFKHLTGVYSPLKAESFYENAKNATLTDSQIDFNGSHPLRTAKKKVICMHQLPQLTSDTVCVLKDMETFSLTYKLGLTNIEFTIGLTENVDFQRNKINGWFLPRTLRINDKAIEKSNDVEFIDFIFSKNAAEDRYSTICYSEPGISIPKVIYPLLDESFVYATETP